MKAYYYNPAAERQLVIINEDQIETKKLCETYDEHGQQCGCYAAGCYSLDNSESDFENDLRNAVEKEFGLLSAYNIMNTLGACVFEFEEEPDETDDTDVEAIESFINAWVKENTSHCDATVFEYHDGSNWHSLAIDVEGVDPALEEVEDELNEKIISEYEDAERTEFVMGKMVFESDSFIFTVTQFASDWTIAEVEEK